MPEELSNSQGRLVWQASYRTWGSTVTEEWERWRNELRNSRIQSTAAEEGENRQRNSPAIKTGNDLRLPEYI
ncbi:RHS protein [Delftia tsuruhatensis]|uniref:RHS domain-containing protein n=1 Tax=Delftia tsuruhatensis TaxID=180282 RepID=UPI001E6FA36B|nr:RHS domain-containing protein [Delftia tsuruhatensis]CAB5723526.1 RHS protein [Delftia tsuruhatensis]CAC9693309.1 RHS protein [Delftia tsuruhatensis]